jgi:hypothetical protein
MMEVTIGAMVEPCNPNSTTAATTISGASTGAKATNQP